MSRRCEIVSVPVGRGFPYEVGDTPVLADHVADDWVEEGTARELEEEMETADAAPQPEDAAVSTEAPGAEKPAPPVDATDAARELAEEHDLDLREVEGTGKDGRVLKSDVDAVVEG